jgi:hypothetical protein
MGIAFSLESGWDEVMEGYKMIRERREGENN